jgi:hypothetical protein
MQRVIQAPQLSLGLLRGSFFLVPVMFFYLLLPSLISSSPAGPAGR